MQKPSVDVYFESSHRGRRYITTVCVPGEWCTHYRRSPALIVVTAHGNCRHSLPSPDRCPNTTDDHQRSITMLLLTAIVTTHFPLLIVARTRSSFLGVYLGFLANSDPRPHNKNSKPCVFLALLAVDCQSKIILQQHTRFGSVPQHWTAVVYMSLAVVTFLFTNKSQRV